MVPVSGVFGAWLLRVLHSFPFPLARHPGQVHLRILGTSDLHVHLLPFDYTADRIRETVGLSRTAGLIAAMRRGSPNTLLFDNGDFLQGSALGDLIARDGLAEGAVHPMVAAMNALRYDAGTLGNHEFSHGLPFLLRALKDMAFPVVSANAETAAGGGLVARHAILDREVRDGEGRSHRLRIGVTGFLPPQTELWDRETLAGAVRTPDILAAAARHLPDLRAERPDLVVALCHSGIEAAVPGGGAENAATALAARPEVDVILAGHTHLVFPGPAHAGLPGVDAGAGTLLGKPAVMPGAYGSHLGVIDLVLDRAPGAGWQIAGARSRAEAVARRRPDGSVRPRTRDRSGIGRIAAAAHGATRERLSEPIGWTAVPLDTHFALAGDGPAGFVVAAAKRDWVREALRGTALSDLPLLATASVFRSGGRGGPENFVDAAAGPLALRHVADLYPFPNTIAALRMTGAQLQAWLDRAASVFRTIRPGEADQPLVDPAVPAYRFFGLLGATYTIDLSAPSGPTGAGPGRIRDLRVGGMTLDPEAAVVVATSSYRAALFETETGAGSLVPLPMPAPRACRDIVADWIRRQGTVAAPPPGWRLALPPRASVTLETAPGARTGRGVAPGLDAEALGLTGDGFLRVRLTAAV